MKWMIWPRQYGKSYQLRQWWVNDPANRVILCENVNAAKFCQEECVKLLEEKYPGNTHRENRLLVRNRVYSWRTWRNSRLTQDQLRCEVAIDGLEAILPHLFKGTISVATAAGSNELPDPEVANRADDFRQEMREKYGEAWNS